MRLDERERILLLATEHKQALGLPPTKWVKGKIIPLQAWTGPEGPRRLRFTDFMTIGT